jgi:hypothetical protein
MAETKDTESHFPLNEKGDIIKTHFFGDAAIEEYKKCLDCARDEGATGGIFGFLRAANGDQLSMLRVREPVADVLLEPETTEFEIILIDSGNIAGSAWKYVYHPLSKIGTFFPES